MIKIQTNVPIPTQYNRICKYPWREMAVGDSFFVAYPTRAILSVKQQVKYNMKISSREVVENKIKGRRYWRVA